jgi:hypothetical protein
MKNRGARRYDFIPATASSTALLKVDIIRARWRM